MEMEPQMQLQVEPKVQQVMELLQKHHWLVALTHQLDQDQLQALLLKHHKVQLVLQVQELEPQPIHH